MIEPPEQEAQGKLHCAQVLAVVSRVNPAKQLRHKAGLVSRQSMHLLAAVQGLQ